jgi:hypothetical protein
VSPVLELKRGGVNEEELHDFWWKDAWMAMICNTLQLSLPNLFLNPARSKKKTRTIFEPALTTKDFMQMNRLSIFRRTGLSCASASPL